MRSPLGAEPSEVHKVWQHQLASPLPGHGSYSRACADRWVQHITGAGRVTGSANVDHDHPRAEQDPKNTEPGHVAEAAELIAFHAH